MQIQQNLDLKASPKVEAKSNEELILTKEDIRNNEGPILVNNSDVNHLSQDERLVFYSGCERMTLQSSQIQKVRNLQEQNDNLQRQLLRCEKELSQVEDPLSIVAEMEHCKALIARNAGEILNIYNQNEERLNRIAKLQEHNINLQQEISDSKGRFIAEHVIEERTKFAAEFFASKTRYEKNLVELFELNQE